MKVDSSRCRNKRAQSGAEYMILLGVVVLVTVWALNNLLPVIVKECAPEKAATSSDECGYATKLFSNIVKKINAN